VDPLGLVLKAGTWYLVAGHRRDVRTYRVGRIVAATTRRERFVRPAGFDLASYWTESSAAFDRSILRERVRIRLSPRAARDLRWFVDAMAAAEALAAAGPPDEDGWVEVELAVEEEAVAAAQLVALGAGVEVLAPASLRARVAATGVAMAELNRAGGGPRARRG
jgi:predicted DNA-binding transcriptional regulator YafY